MAVHTYHNINNTRRAALAFGAILAVDLGVTSEVISIQGGHRVVADDGKAVDFLKGGV